MIYDYSELKELEDEEGDLVITPLDYVILDCGR